MNKRNGLLRMLAAALSCIMAFGLVAGLAGCGKNNDEQLIRASITDVMDTFKNPTKENLQKYLSDSDESLETLDTYGVDIYEFMEHCFKHFDYKINEVKVDGNTATASLTLTNADLTAAMNAAQTDLENSIADYQDVLYGDNAEQEIVKILFTKLYEQLDASDQLVTTDATLSMTKTDGEWDVDEDSMDAVISAMYGGLVM